MAIPTVVCFEESIESSTVYDANFSLEGRINRLLLWRFEKRFTIAFKVGKSLGGNCNLNERNEALKLEIKSQVLNIYQSNNWQSNFSRIEIATLYFKKYSNINDYTTINDCTTN